MEKDIPQSNAEFGQDLLESTSTSTVWQVITDCKAVHDWTAVTVKCLIINDYSMAISNAHFGFMKMTTTLSQWAAFW